MARDRPVGGTRGQALKHRRVLLDAVLVMVGMAVICTLVLTTRARHVRSDAYLGLLVSQSILEHGTITLDPYAERVNLEDTHSVYKADGHYYHFFPLGTPLISIPAVWLANLAGMDMATADAVLQMRIAAAVCALVFLVLYLVGRCYLSPSGAFVVTSVWFLGSTLISTMGTALWSHDYLVLLESVTLLLLVLDRTGRRDLNSYLIGVLLFAAYLVRPTAAVFIIVVFGYLWFRNRRHLLRTAGVSCVLLLMYLGFNMVAYGQPLPPYYARGLGDGKFWTALYGLLLSPSRGLLVYSPFLVVVLAAAALTIGRLRREPLFLFAGAWAVLHTLLLANWWDWWGGWSYGPRLFTDVLPGLVLVAFLSWRETSSSASSFFKRAAAVMFLALGLAGIAMHAGQGIRNPWVTAWNQFPDVNTHTELLFDWRYPQFLTTPETLKLQILDYYFPGKTNVNVEFYRDEGGHLGVRAEQHSPRGSVDPGG